MRVESRQLQTTIETAVRPDQGIVNCVLYRPFSGTSYSNVYVLLPLATRSEGSSLYSRSFQDAIVSCWGRLEVFRPCS